MGRMTPCLWFNGQAEEAAGFYVSVFPNSRITKVDHYLEGSPGTPGTVMTVEFILDGNEFLALNAGPEFKFSPAISYMIDCATQAEVDYFWEKLSEDGEVIECGWLTDRYGLTWQVVPTILSELLADPDREKAQRVFTAMLGMKKLDIEEFLRAARGE